MSTARKILRRGFTLIEVVTTLAIMAALAAVVIPQVVRQFDAADPTRVQSDLKALQTAVETFHVNVRNSYPGDLDDLSNPIVTNATLATAVDSGLAASPTLYSATEVSAWTGPYVDFALTETAAGSSRPTGYGAVILDNFVCFNATQSTAATSGTSADPSCPAPAGTDRLFLAVRISGLAAGSAAFITLNDRFDGNAEVSRATEGRLRQITVGAVTTTYFLASPLN